MIIDTSIKKYDRLTNKVEILRKGSIDEDLFKAQAVKKYFRKLADNYKLAANVKANYLETYDLDKYHWIKHAGQLFVVNIQGLFSFQQITRVTQTNREL